MARTAVRRLTEIVPGVWRFRDTCNVYVLQSGREAVLIDFGSGDVLDRLDELGVERVTDVLVTHHHRDQVQGLARAAAAGIRMWVPPVEVEMFTEVERRWQARQIDDDYELRQDRFSLLEPAAVTGTVAEYRTHRFGGFDVHTLPTPGHTVGSVTYLIETEGRRLAFSGDLLCGRGQVWSLAATQWTYTGVEGQAATSLSLGVLARREPDLILPSHGDPIEDVDGAVGATRARLQELMELRQPDVLDADGWLEQPWAPLSPHLLRNRTSFATTYALLSDDGAAVLIDFGFDLWTGFPPGFDRAAQRPLLYSIEALRRDHGVERIEAVVVTHYHDDHVAGLNLLREVEGTEVWAPDNVAPLLEDPRRYDVPCLWAEPIRVDRNLVPRRPLEWHEYTLTTYPLPGHTLYAAAIGFEVDGRRVLATGDQQSFEEGGRSTLNYQYRNRFRIDDFVASAELYLSLRPQLMLTGHWGAHEVDEALLQRLLEDGRRLAQLHRELLPLEDAEGFPARIEPYRSRVRSGEETRLDVLVRNPFTEPAQAVVELVVPAGWTVDAAQEAELPARGEATISFGVRPAAPGRRARVAADVTIGGTRFGQQAEALVDVE